MIINTRLFYFCYQLKIQLLPLVAQQIDRFAIHCQQSLKASSNPHSNDTLIRAAKKQLQKLEDFHYEHYEDYRVSLVPGLEARLRSIIKKLKPPKPPSESKLTHQIVEEVKPKADYQIQSAVTQLVTMKQKVNDSMNRSLEGNKSQRLTFGISHSPATGGDSLSKFTPKTTKAATAKDLKKFKPLTKSTIMKSQKQIKPTPKLQGKSSKVFQKVPTSKPLLTNIQSRPSIKQMPSKTLLPSGQLIKNPTAARLKPVTKKEFIEYLSKSVQRK